MATTTALDPRTAAAIRDAMAALSRGRVDEARRIGEASLASGGDKAALNAMIGTLCLQSGELEDSVRYLRDARAERGEDFIIALNLATALVQLGRYAEALDAASDSLAEQDKSLRLHRIRAFCAQSLEDYAVAVPAYERIIQSAPGDWESWNNLGNSRRGANDLDGAIEALEEAAKIASDAAPVRLNLANTLMAAGQFDRAEAAFKAMATDFPEDWRAPRDLHVMLRSQAREEDALAAIEEASRRNPSDLGLLLAVASQKLLLLDSAGAEEAYAEVVRRDPGNPSGNLGLAVVFELTNRTAELSQLVGDAQSRGVEGEALNLIRAFDHRRGKRFEEGLVALGAVSGELETARQAQLLGQLNDGAGNYDAAWQAFSQMNEIQRADPSDPEGRAARYRQSVRQNLQATTAQWADAWNEVTVDDGRSSPVFLVGFPRSGTTLLDTILMSHPDVEVLEEEPTLHRAGELMADYPRLPELTREAVQAARNAYFDSVSKRTPMTPGKLIVDKNPLYTAAIPLIRRIFPDAKIILAVRHPCDVVLSCFTTNFKLNDGMSSFLRLETTAELYDLCFRYFERVCELLPIATHRVTYENVVADREQELRPLFEFLGLDWDENVLDHQTTALKRGRIKTASYSQVAEPIYARSSGRWRNYQKHLEPVMSVLDPWITKFGFEN